MTVCRHGFHNRVMAYTLQIGESAKVLSKHLMIDFYLNRAEHDLIDIKIALAEFHLVLQAEIF